MRGNYRLTFLLVILLFFAQDTLADAVVGVWSPQDVKGVNDKTIELATRLGVEEISKKNLTIDSWPDAFLLLMGAFHHQGDKTLINALISQLTDRTKVELKDTSKLIIWERITTGELLFEGRGYQISDDLFTVAGRANWMLRNITKKNFGHVKPDTPEDELIKLQRKWYGWLKGEPVEEYQDEYALSGKAYYELKRGLTGPETIEALIASLKPHKGKDALREKCLGIEAQLPGEREGGSTTPGMEEICDPNTFARLKLFLLTGIRDKHGYDWWKKWWDTNKNQLVWKKEREMFEVRK